MPRKLAFIELMQETNSFSSLTTSLEEFQRFALHYGPATWTFADRYKTQGYGFREAVQKHSKGEFEILPVFSAWAWSGGPIEQETYLSFRDHAVEQLKNATDLAGIYLSMHGAMGVKDMRDPESDFLQALRSVVGPDMPIVMSFDLHANVTEENARQVQALLGYRTNPHRDFRSVGRKSGELLMKIVRGQVKPVTVFKKMRLLKGGGMGVDFLSPMRGILRRMSQMERIPKVLAVTNFWVHIWMDDEELGWSVTVTTDNDPQLAERLANELCDRNWKVRHRKHPQPKDLEEAIAIARKATIRRRLGCVTFCDVSDIVGAGAPGANTNILKALLEQAPHLNSFIPVRDPIAAVTAFESPASRIKINVGGSIDPDLNPTVPMDAEIIFRKETSWGKTAVLRQQGVHVILTEMPFPAYFANDFKEVGLNLWKADITVVKNLFPFRYRLLKYNRRTVNVISNGITHLDVHKLQYERIPRPIFPLDEVLDWR